MNGVASCTLEKFEEYHEYQAISSLRLFRQMSMVWRQQKFDEKPNYTRVMWEMKAMLHVAREWKREEKQKSSRLIRRNKNTIRGIYLSDSNEFKFQYNDSRTGAAGAATARGLALRRV